MQQEVNTLPHLYCLPTHTHTYRHLNLAQTVSLCVVTAGDAMERARLLHRFIEIASMLQSGNYGNLFSFIAVMQGLAVPQVRTKLSW